jgi:lysophospholipase L1-like esterase
VQINEDIIIKRLFLILITVSVLAFSNSCAKPNPADNMTAGSGDGTGTVGLPVITEVKPDSTPINIVCLGDSVTAGVFELIRTGSYNFGGYVYDVESAYPSLLETILREKYGYDAVVYNAGVSGDTVDRGIARLEDDVFSHDPDIVTVCFGLNDVGLDDPDLFISQLSELFETIRAWKPDVKIVFITPNMLATYVNEATKDDDLNYAMACGNVSITESGMLDVYMDAARQVCADNNIPVCDVYSYWKQLYEDGEDITALLATYVTHPSRAMHKVFADMLAETLLKYNIIS